MQNIKPSNNNEHWLLKKFYQKPFYVIFSTIMVITAICILLTKNNCGLKRFAFAVLVIIVVFWARKDDDK